MRRFIGLCVTGLLLGGLVSSGSRTRAEDASAELRAQHEAMVAKATSFLLTKGRANDGSYSSLAGPGVTSLVTTALLRSGVSPADPRVEASLAYIRARIQPDGGIYQEGSYYGNYETCLAMLCLAEANRDGKYDETLKRADAYVKGLQWDESEGKQESDLSYGGAGYGKSKRADLSNTAFLIEALKAAGNGADSDAIQRALIFVSRTQTWKASTIQRHFPPRIPTAASTTHPTQADTAKRERPIPADCAAMLR